TIFSKLRGQAIFLEACHLPSHKSFENVPLKVETYQVQAVNPVADGYDIYGERNMKRISIDFTLMRLLVAALLPLLFLATSLSAQSIATRVNGTTKDPSGASVSGAKVTLTDLATGRQVSVNTNQEGFFVFTDVRAGLYKVTVEKEGFKKAEV